MDGDHRAFLDATMPYLDVVYRIARHVAPDSWAAEDLVQETYLRAFAHFAQHRGGDTRAWLAAICLNTARSEARRVRRRPAELPESAAGERPGAPDEVADRALGALDRASIAAGLAKLPEEQRLCLLLMDVAGYTARETANLLGCPRGTVLARAHRGRRRLAGWLATSDVEGEVDRGSP